MRVRAQFSAAALVASVYLVCSCPAAGPETTRASPPSSNAATQPAAPPPTLELIGALDKPYEDVYFKDRGAVGWAKLLRDAHTWDGGHFDVARRDRLLNCVRKVVDELGSKTTVHVLVIESVSRNGPNAPEYDRVALFTDPDGLPEAVRSFSALGLRRVTPDEYHAFRDPLKAAMAAKGSNNGIKSVSDAVEALVITHYDGKEWRVETWFWLQTAPYMADVDAPRREALPPPLGALIDLIEAAQPYGAKAKGFGPPTYRDLIKSFPKTVRVADPK